jgi:hypothetical protein
MAGFHKIATKSLTHGHQRYLLQPIKNGPIVALDSKIKQLIKIQVEDSSNIDKIWDTPK